MPSSITLTVSHLPTSTSFYLSTLQPIDYVYRGRVNNTIGFGKPNAPPDFWISQETPGVPAGAAHVAFPAASQKQVQAFFLAALKAGGKCHGEPMLRDHETGYYSAAIIDFDGNSIEAVHRPDLLDSSDDSRPGSVVSIGSNKSKSPSKAAMSTTSKATPTVVSKAPTTASKAQSTASSKAPTAVSRAPTAVSKAPTAVSKSPTTVSVAKSSASSAKPPSVVPSAAGSSASRSPPKSTVSRVPTEIQYQNPAPANATMSVQTTTTTRAPNDAMANMINDAQGAIKVARDLVDQVRPHLTSNNSAPAASDPQSHQPSDTIVGTLLGVAAGAALHYAYSKATNTDNAQVPMAMAPLRPSLSNADRSVTEPSYADERYYYYHQYQATPRHQGVLEPAQSTYSTGSQQRYITMEDGPAVSEYQSSIRPRRRSSFDGSQLSPSQAGGAGRSMRMLEAPPSSFRGPTAVTEISSLAPSNATGRSRSRSRVSSLIRSVSASGKSSSLSSVRSRRLSSDEDAMSYATVKTATTAQPASSYHSSHHPSSQHSDAGSERTVVPIRRDSGGPPSKAGSKVPSRTASKQSSRAPSPSSKSRVPSTAGREPGTYPLPPSRAATWANGGSDASLQTAHSKTNKTVIGRLLKERESSGGSGGRSDMTKSVVSKAKDVAKLNLPDEEVRPDDSISQISVNTSSSKKSKSSRK